MLSCEKCSADHSGSYASGISWDDLPLNRKYERVLQEQNHSCNKCGIKDWMQNPIIFDLHHKDGSHSNSNRVNLEYLCCNCHSQTPNFCGRKLRKQ